MTLPTASNTSRPRAKGYDCELGGYYLRLVANQQSPLLRQTANAIPDRVATEVNPEDMGEEVSRTASRVDFLGGEGLEFLHRRDGSSDPTNRFWDSSGLEITNLQSGQRRLRLSPAIEDISGVLIDDQLMTRAVLYDDNIWVVRNDSGDWDLYRCSDPTVASPTWTEEDPHVAEGNQNINSMCTDGSYLYVGAPVNGVHRRNNSGTWAHWSDFVPTNADLYAVNGRIFSANATGVYEVKSGTGSTLLFAYPGGVSLLADVVDFGAAIGFIVRAQWSNQSWIYLFTEENGEMVQANVIDFPDARVTHAVMRHGVILYFTTSDDWRVLKLWRGTLTGQFSIEADLVRVWDYREDASPPLDTGSYLMTTEEAAYFTTGRNSPSSEYAELWQYNYATGGLIRLSAYDDGAWGTSDERSLIEWDGRLILKGARHIHRQSYDDYATTGWLISPLIDFYTDRDKEWLDLALWFEDLGVSDEEIRLYYSTDPDAISSSTHSSWVLLKTYSGSDSSGDVQTLTDVRSRWLAIKVEMDPSTDQATSPELIGFSARAYVGTDNVRYLLPVNVSDVINRPNRQRLRVKGRGEALYQALVALEGNQVNLEIFRPNETSRVVVTSVATPIDVLADDGTSLRTALVQAEGYIT